MGRGIVTRRSFFAAMSTVALGALASSVVGQLPAISDPQAIERFRVAAALQNRELYDLAADDWAAFCRDFLADPLVPAARCHRGACLFHLKRYDEVCAELEPLVDELATLEPTLAEQCRAQLAMAHFNLALVAADPQRSEHLRKAVAMFDCQLAAFADGKLAPQSAFYRCEVLYAAGKLESAIEAYRELLSKYPDHAERADATYALGVTEQEHGALAEAAATFERFLAAYPEHDLAADARLRRSESLLALGLRWLQAGKADDAMDVLASAAALPRWERSDAVLLALADAQLKAAKPQAAVVTIARLLAEFPNSALTDRAYWRRAESYAAIESWSAAVNDCTTLCDQFPDSPLVPPALVARARSQLRGGDAAGAEDSLNLFLREHSEQELAIEAQLLRAAVRYQRSDFAGGIADADALLAENPPLPVRSDALYLLGLCQLGLRQPAAAVDSFEQVVKRDPQFRLIDRVLYDLAWAFQESGDTARAIETYERLVMSHPESALAAEALYRVGEVHFAAREYVAASGKFQLAIQQTADPAVGERSAHKLAWCFFEQQKFPAAEQAFEKQLTSYPKGSLAADGRLMHAECQFHQNQFDKALESFARALEDQTATPALRQSGLLHASRAAAQTEQWNRCLALADRAIAEFPGAGWIDEARCERGLALFRLGRFDDAQQQLSTIRGNGNPIGARAEFVAGQIHAARGEQDAALRAFFKVAYGYGDAAVPAPIREWQAESLYEAAQCLEQTDRVESARELYKELVDRHPESAKAPAARQALQQSLRR